MNRPNNKNKNRRKKNKAELYESYVEVQLERCNIKNTDDIDKEKRRQRR